MNIQLTARMILRSRASDVADRLLTATKTARGHLPDAWQERQILDEIDQLLIESTDRLGRALRELP